MAGKSPTGEIPAQGCCCFVGIRVLVAQRKSAPKAEVAFEPPPPPAHLQPKQVESARLSNKATKRQAAKALVTGRDRPCKKTSKLRQAKLQSDKQVPGFSEQLQSVPPAPPVPFLPEIADATQEFADTTQAGSNKGVRGPRSMSIVSAPRVSRNNSHQEVFVTPSRQSHGSFEETGDFPTASAVDYPSYTTAYSVMSAAPSRTKHRVDGLVLRGTVEPSDPYANLVQGGLIESFSSRSTSCESASSSSGSLAKRNRLLIDATTRALLSGSSSVDTSEEDSTTTAGLTRASLLEENDEIIPLSMPAEPRKEEGFHLNISKQYARGVLERKRQHLHMQIQMQKQRQRQQQQLLQQQLHYQSQQDPHPQQHYQSQQDPYPQQLEVRRPPKQQLSQLVPVLLEEVEVRPGEAECFCFKCVMEPGTGIPLFSLTEAWGGARHSAKRKPRQPAPRIRHQRPAGGNEAFPQVASPRSNSDPYNDPLYQQLIE